MKNTILTAFSKKKIISQLIDKYLKKEFIKQIKYKIELHNFKN